MASVRFLKQLPQKYALSGLKRRTAFESNFPNMPRVPSGMSSFSEPEMFESPPMEAPVGQEDPESLGPYISPTDPPEIGGLDTPPPGREINTIMDMLSYKLGDDLAMSMGKRGGKSAAMTGGKLIAMDAPQKMIAPAISRSLASMFFPAAALNTGLSGISGAFDASDLVAGIDDTFDPETQEEVVNAFNTKTQPQSLPGQILMGMYDDYDPPSALESLWGHTKGFLSGKGYDSPADKSLALARSPELANLSIEENRKMKNPPTSISPDERGLIDPTTSEFMPGILEAMPIEAPPDIEVLDPSAGEGEDPGTVLCTELYRQGIMPENIYRLDAEYGDSLPEDVMKGYQIWAAPLAKSMAKSKFLTNILSPLIMAWGRHMAGEKNVFGYAVEKIGIPVCGFIGKIPDRTLIEA